MGKYDKDRRQKELAIRCSLARRLAPCLEVVVPSSSDLSDSAEVVTDLDVLALEFVADGGFRRILHDCKTGKMSAINRALWAAGLLKYTKVDNAIIILKSKIVTNHRLSALQINVDLHDEESFSDFAATFEMDFDSDKTYLSNIDRWNAVYEAFKSNPWSESAYALCRNVAPLSHQPWSVFRKIVAEVRQNRGQYDPRRAEHMSIFYDVLSAVHMLWCVIGKDLRRIYVPSMEKDEFERIFRYYIWGGRESFSVRQELNLRSEDGSVRELKLPGWQKLVQLAGVSLSAPQQFFGCINICRSLSVRELSGVDIIHEANLKSEVKDNRRAIQFILSMTDYMVEACSLPKDMYKAVEVAMLDLSK